MGKPTRWVTDHDDNHSQWYIDRFRTMADEGADLEGEARLVDAMVPRGARILDAGCGPGRISGALARNGHRVVGVDADAALIEAAKADYPGPTYLVADLADMQLADLGEAELFDAVVVAGNVMAFVAPGSEPDVMATLAAHVRADGPVVVGFGTNRGYALADFDTHGEAAGLVLEHRFATWDLRPFRNGSDFAVTVWRKPAD